MSDRPRVSAISTEDTDYPRLQIPIRKKSTEELVDQLLTNQILMLSVLTQISEQITQIIAELED